MKRLVLKIMVAIITMGIVISCSKVNEYDVCYELKGKGYAELLKLKMNDDIVSGTYRVLPDRKDATKGSIKGIRTGNKIKAVFEYMIEGQQQSEVVLMEINMDQITVMRPDVVIIKGEKVQRDGGVEISSILFKTECP